jgi:hypothetical protein
MHKRPEAWRERAPKKLETGRCCWVCGRVGGQGFTAALIMAGYRREHDREMGYAHNKCMAQALKDRKSARF